MRSRATFPDHWYVAPLSLAIITMHKYYPGKNSIEAETAAIGKGWKHLPQMVGKCPLCHWDFLPFQIVVRAVATLVPSSLLWGRQSSSCSGIQAKIQYLNRRLAQICFLVVVETVLVLGCVPRWLWGQVQKFGFSRTLGASHNRKLTFLFHHVVCMFVCVLSGDHWDVFCISVASLLCQLNCALNQD